MFASGFSKVASAVKKQVADLAKAVSHKTLAMKPKSVNQVRSAAEAVKKAPAKLSVNEAMALTGMKKAASEKKKAE